MAISGSCVQDVRTQLLGQVFYLDRSEALSIVDEAATGRRYLATPLPVRASMGARALTASHCGPGQTGSHGREVWSLSAESAAGTDGQDRRRTWRGAETSRSPAVGSSSWEQGPR